MIKHSASRGSDKSYNHEGYEGEPRDRDLVLWTVVLEERLESPLDCKEIQPVHPKENQSWIFTGRTDAEAEIPILWPPDENWLIWKDPDAGKYWAGGELDDRGWDGWMASLTQWTWVWVDSGSWWWTGRPGVLQSMGSLRVRHDWATELNWTELRNREGGKDSKLIKAATARHKHVGSHLGVCLLIHYCRKFQKALESMESLSGTTLSIGWKKGFELC